MHPPKTDSGEATQLPPARPLARASKTVLKWAGFRHSSSKREGVRDLRGIGYRGKLFRTYRLSIANHWTGETCSLSTSSKTSLVAFSIRG